MTFVRPLVGTLALVSALYGGLFTSLAHAQTGAAANPPASLPPAPSAAAPAPVWSETQWQALWDAAQHTAGLNAYEFKWLFYADISRARLARVSGVRSPNAITAANLIAVPKPIRLALVNLYVPGEKSALIPYTNRGTNGWLVVELVRVSSAAPLRTGADFEKDARDWVAKGLLPAPDGLLADPAERARVAYWRALTPQSISAIAPDLSPNVEYGDFFTPLTRAVLTDRRELVSALLDHGANINQCGLLGCALHLAQGMPDEKKAQDWTQWLLDRGAKPDTVDSRHQAANDTPLAAAVGQGRLGSAEALVKAGASPDGVPQVPHTPIYQAAVNHHKDMVNWLIARGASVLPFADRGNATPGVPAHLYAAAQATEDKDFIAWAEQTMVSAAQTSPEYRYNAFLEQGKQRFPLKDGAALTIKAAPFKLVLELKPGESTAVDVGASFEKAWSDEVRRGDRRNPLFHPFSSGALAEPPSEDSYDLLVGQPCPATAKADDLCPGVLFTLQTDSASRKDFHELRAGSHEYVRESRRVFDVSVDKGTALPLEQFQGKTLYMVLSAGLNLGGIDGLRLVGPRFVSLKLQK